MKANTALGPFLEFAENILSDENNVGRAANQFVFRGVRLGHHEGENGRAVRRSDSHKAFAGLELGVVGEMEAEFVHEETDTAVVIAHEDVDALDAEMGSDRARGHGEIIKRRCGRSEGQLDC